MAQHSYLAKPHVPLRGVGGDPPIPLPNSPNRNNSFDSWEERTLPEGISSIDHGIDTVHFSFYGISNVEKLFSAQAVVDTVTGELFPVKRWGGTIEIPSCGVNIRRFHTRQHQTLVRVEVRRLEFILRDRNVGRVLARVGNLLRGVDRARERLARLGFDEETAEVRLARCDLAADVTFESRIDAGLFLRALDSLSIAGWRQFHWTLKGTSSLQSVGFQSRSGIEFRTYDETAPGLKERIDDPSLSRRRIRLERQFRRSGKKQPTPEEFLSVDHEALFLDRLGSWNLEMLEIGPREGRVRRVQSWIEGGVLTPATADTLVGSHERDCLLGDDAWADQRTASRRRAQFRRFGLTSIETAGETLHIGNILLAAGRRFRQRQGGDGAGA